MYIEIQNVTKTIHKQMILNHVCLHMEKGLCYGIVGQNGCGKTMLMRAICGFLKPDEGQVVVDGKEIGKDCEFIQNAGVMIGETSFQKNLTGLDNLRILAEIKHRISEEEILEALKQVNLYEVRMKKYGEYSMGMKQRLRIAQAIMEREEILILDEPFNGLDKKGVAEIRELLLYQKTQGRTIILTSHYEKDIELLCDKVVEMDQGEIVI